MNKKIISMFSAAAMLAGCSAHAREISADTDFGKRIATPESYQAILQQTRTALYSEFPEVRGKIEILDQTAKPDAEIDRITESFDLSNDIDKRSLKKTLEDGLKMPPGHMVEFTDLHFNNYAVALGWPPDGSVNNLSVGKTFIHETTHGLDFIFDPVTFAKQAELHVWSITWQLGGMAPRN